MAVGGAPRTEKFGAGNRDRWRRRAVAMLAAAGAAVTIAACSSSGPPIMTQSPTITGTSERFHFDAAHVPSSDWPDPCSLLSRSDAQAGLGTSVNLRRFHSSCFYQPQSGMYPTLTVTIMAVGTASGDAYDATSQSNEGLDRTSVDIGTRAYLHPVRDLPAYGLEVLTDQAYFSVTEQSPVGLKISAAQAHTLLVGIGRSIARAFRG